MNSVPKLKVLLSTLSLALLAGAPLVQAQTNAPSAASAAAPADTPPPPPPGAWGKGGMRQSPISKVTNLTADQKAKIKTIQEAARAKMEALPDDDGRRAAGRQIMADSMKQVRAVLTDAQKAQYDAAVKQMMRGRKRPGGDDSAPPPPPPPPGS